MNTNRIIYVLLGALAANSGFAGCERKPQDSDSAAMQNSPIAAEVEAEKRIKDRLDAADDLKAADVKVEVDAKKKVATLSGAVETKGLRARTIELVRNVRPDLTIHNQIVVNPDEASQGRRARESAQEELRNSK